MGKERRRKRKLHVAAVKEKEIGNEFDIKMETNAVDVNMPSEPALGDNLFSGIDINTSKMTKKLPDFDARSTITSKTFRGTNVTKKQKRQIKHDTWLLKVDAIQNAQKKEKLRKKRQKTAVVGDMTPLEDALPTLDLLMKKGYAGEEYNSRIKTKSIKKESVRKKQMLHQIGLFQKLLHDKKLKENPQHLITEILKKRMSNEESKDSKN